MKVRFIQISSGGVFGISDQKFLLPVDAITSVDEAIVRVNQTGQRISSSPAYSPDIAEDVNVVSIYDYYGYPPYWAPGYVYPPYPFYSGSRVVEGRSERRSWATPSMETQPAARDVD